MSDAAVGWLVIVALIAVGVAGVTLWWRYNVRADAEGFYRRLHEKEQKRREAGPPGI
jgi:Flp pilus assembly protein TadB